MRHGDIDAIQVGKSYGFGLPFARVIEFGSVVAIAKIVDDHVIALHFGPSGLDNIILPVAVVRGFQGKPSDENQAKQGSTNEKTMERRVDANRKYKGNQDIDCRW